MTRRYPGSLIRATPLVPGSTLASGVWTVPEQFTAVGSSQWPFSAITVALTASTQTGTDATTYSFAAQSFGTTTDADRFVIVGICQQISSVSVTGCTIGGVVATSMGSPRSIGNTTSGRIQFFSAQQLTSAAGAVEIAFGGATNRCGIGIWKKTGGSNSIVVGSTGGRTVTATTGNASVTVVKGGAVLGLASAQISAGTNTLTWSGITGATTDYSKSIEGVEDIHSGLSYHATVGSVLTATVTHSSGGGAGMGFKLVALNP